MNEIEKMIERQFDNFLQRRGPAVIFGIDELLRFVAEEPAVAALADTIRERNSASLERVQETARAFKTSLARIWADGFGDEVGTKVEQANADERDELTFQRSPSGFEAGLRPEKYENNAEQTIFLLRDLRNLFEVASRWNDWKKPLVPDDVTEARAKEFSSAIKELRRLERSLAASCEAGSGTALERLENQRKSIIHGSVQSSDLLELLESGSGEDVASVHNACNDVRAAAADLRTGLLLELGRVRTRVAVVNRYKQRAEWFERERLRELSDLPYRAEALLTLDFAKYLFDAGLTPLLDASHGHVRPDVLSFTDGPLFYVEAKQYKSSPGPMLKDAYGQVWNTWTKLGAIYPCNEAFLLVFRRGGQHVSLPDVIRRDGLKLYSRVVDLTDDVGSSAGQKPLVLTEADVMGMLL